MAFLQPFRGMSHVVVYAGAAPGLHVPILAEMFPEMRFLLIDPFPSAITDGQLPNVVTLEVCMTDQMATELGDRHSMLLFISDVRVGIPAEDEQTEPSHDHQVRVHRDMMAQMGWYRRMRPRAGLLKFRLPWDIETQTQYLHGTIHFPIFGRPFTHESRLVVIGPDPPTTTYDNTVYERQMAYFNQATRPSTYTGGKCYDCTAFAAVVAEYLGVQPRAQQVYAECRRIEKELARITAEWGETAVGARTGKGAKRFIITLPSQRPTAGRFRAPRTGSREEEEGRVVVSQRDSSDEQQHAGEGATELKVIECESFCPEEQVSDAMMQEAREVVEVVGNSLQQTSEEALDSGVEVFPLDEAKMNDEDWVQATLAFAVEYAHFQQTRAVASLAKQPHGLS
jgi:hypothetical protein